MSGQIATAISSPSLADILDRILDKGMVIVGDIKIAIADVELLTIKIRLLIASVERAKEIGVAWWDKEDQVVGTTALRMKKENEEVRKRLEAIESKLK